MYLIGSYASSSWCTGSLITTRHGDDACVFGDTRRTYLFVLLVLWSLAATLR
jgi:hypothetical protein